ncbi:F-box protein [Medicago truncatula]|uniref:F-box protein n=1 Tax=Medicago truncatula TaxID=3880 RepID=G7LFE6_MEDTR|nr:F-box protein [Medicago truncatula]
MISINKNERPLIRILSKRKIYDKTRSCYLYNSDSYCNFDSYCLSHDLITKVLSLIDVKSLMQMRFVCKSWKSIISDPAFIKIYITFLD